MRKSALVVLAGICSLLGASAAQAIGGGASVVAGAGGYKSFRVQVAAQSTPAGTSGHFSVTGDGYFHDLEVRCIRTLDDRTVAGGVIVDSSNPVVIGHTGLVAIRDGAPGGSDEMNVAFSISGLDICPSDTSTIPLNPVVHGNFVVK